MAKRYGRHELFGPEDLRPISRSPPGGIFETQVLLAGAYRHDSAWVQGASFAPGTRQGRAVLRQKTRNIAKAYVGQDARAHSTTNTDMYYRYATATLPLRHRYATAKIVTHVRRSTNALVQ